MLADKSVIPMEETVLYKEDLIGLKQLNDEKRISKSTIGGTHLKWTPAEVKDIMIPAL